MVVKFIHELQSTLSFESRHLSCSCGDWVKMMCSLGRFLEAQMSENSVIIQSTIIRIHLLECSVADSIETGSCGRFVQSSLCGFMVSWEIRGNQLPTPVLYLNLFSRSMLISNEYVTCL